MLTLLAIFLLGQTNVLAPDVNEILIVLSVPIVADFALSYVSRVTFQREEILTKWK
jgi:hypothetical protein